MIENKCLEIGSDDVNYFKSKILLSVARYRKIHKGKKYGEPLLCVIRRDLRRYKLLKKVVDIYSKARGLFNDKK